jgi:hypothetical protein
MQNCSADDVYVKHLQTETNNAQVASKSVRLSVDFFLVMWKSQWKQIKVFAFLKTMIITICVDNTLPFFFSSLAYCMAIVF